MPVVENYVETHGLTKSFGNFTAVDDVSFNIKEGEIFGLLGPNGAGKTTVIRMLCGIMLPTDGTANVLGFDIRENPEAIKSRIGYMSQKFSLYNDLTPVENIEFYAAIYGVPVQERRSRVTELIHSSGLQDHTHLKTRHLSGAWRQRLALACSMVHRPPLLFLDEATAGVDPVSRREFWELIYQMAGEGTSVLATTHYMDEADYCNQIGMMYRGRLIGLASPDDLKKEIPGALLQINCSDVITAEKILDPQPYVLDSAVHGMMLHALIKTEKNQKDVIRILEENNITVVETEFIQPTLEDVFIYIIEKFRAENGIEETN